jgi:hypothetical protein
MTTASIGGSPDRHAALDRSLHDIAWGLLFTLTGAVWLVPAEKVPQGPGCLESPPFYSA